MREYLDGLLPLLAGQAAASRGDGDHARVAADSWCADARGVHRWAAEEFAIYGQLPSYRAMLDREGFSGPEDAAIIGDEKTVSERLEELAKAGVDEFAAVTFDPSPEGRERTRALLRTKDK
jgi:5,10-methylenetetrahydromethanopterin reductase